MLDPSFSCNPKIISKYSGLAEFWKIFNRALNVSPLDGDGYPSISMLPYIVDVDKIGYSKEEFWCCVEYTMLKYREKIPIKRKKMLDDMKRK